MGSPRNVEYRKVGQNPWWIPPFLGGVPAGLSPEHLSLLGVLSFAMFFENYDFSLLGNALPQLGRTFGLSKGALGDFTSITRLGALPAFLFVPLADRIGRRRVVLLSVIGMSLGSVLTATSQSARPLTGLLREHPRRALAIGLIGLMSSAGIAVSFQFISEFLQTLRGWTPGRFALMSFFFGALGIIGNPVAGRMADRFGRRRVIVVALLAFPALVATFYAGPARFVAIPWTAMVFTNMASGVMLRALATELFPTAFRGAAGGTLALLETLGAVVWLFLYSRAMARIGNQQLVIPLLSLATIVAAGAVFFVPETARRELEQISDEGASRTQ